MIVKKAKAEDIQKLRPIACEWRDTCNGDRFGIEIDVKAHLADLARLIEREDADLFLLVNEGKAVGYIGVTIFDSPLGGQKVAQEHYWFVTGKNRGRGVMKLIRAVNEWAKEKGCSHIIFNASNLASDKHDNLCVFYEKIGFSKFETSFIKEII